MLLQDLNERITRDKKNMEKYGISKPTNMNTLLQKERIKINIVEATEKLQQLLLAHPNADELIPIYNQITQSIINYIYICSMILRILL